MRIWPFILAIGGVLRKPRPANSQETQNGESVVKLRGFCKDSPIDTLFTLKQMPEDPDHMMLLGNHTTQIIYNKESKYWKLNDAKYNVSAISRNSNSNTSSLLGKHNWTVSNDAFECNEGQPYVRVLKLTSCNQTTDFTCDDGQCKPMGERCNQVPNCDDESDEKGCQLVVLREGYNKNLAPVRRKVFGGFKPAIVGISIMLMKVVDIDEVGHSIHLQFQIILQWRENRAKYQNLKGESSLNALTDDDIQRLWLPLIIYDNTDQKESTRLGMGWEWTTRVVVVKEGNFERAGMDEVDEANIFKGAENNLTMSQTYTHKFQCQYKLLRYPFDTQVQ